MADAEGYRSALGVVGELGPESGYGECAWSEDGAEWISDSKSVVDASEAESSSTIGSQHDAPKLGWKSDAKRGLTWI